MTAPAAITGDYVGLRFVATRKVCQIVLEIPLEAGASFVAAFGTPNPAEGVPVAIARLDPNAGNEKKGGKLAQKAGILCSEKAFRTFLAERDPELSKAVKMLDLDMAADEVRSICGIESRAELDHNETAARKFHDLDVEYKAWLKVPA